MKARSKVRASEEKRPTWDEYFMQVAELVSKRATCLRRRVGAVLVKDKRILATGYNGAPSGITHCEVTGCLRDKLGIPSGERHELCLPPEEEVLTDEGYVPIQKIELGQRIFTHKGVYRKVTKIFKRKYEGKLCYIEPWHLLPVALTPEHPVLAIRAEMCQFDRRTLCKETCRSVNRSRCYRPYLDYRLDWIPAYQLSEKDLVPLSFDSRSFSVEELDLSFAADSPQRYYEVAQARSEGKSYLEIQKELNIFPSTALNWMRGGVPRNCTAVYDNVLKHGSSPAKSIPNKIRLTDALLRLIGFYLAEGCSSSNQVSFSFHKKETGYIEEIKVTMKEIFGLNCYEYRRRNSHKLVYSSIILARIFKSLFGKDAYMKKLPNPLMRLSPERQRHMLTAYVQGDGYRPDNNTAIITTASKELALQVMHIALRLGYNPMIDKDRNVYRVIWKDKRKIPYGYIKDSLFFNPIRKTWTKEYSGFVYNLEVEEDHSYVTRSFIVHNCRGLHAEQNVLLQAALYGVSTRESVLYITNQPCIICAKMIINAGIREIVFRGSYPDEMSREFLREAKIKARRLK